MSYYGTVEDFADYIEARGGDIPTDDTDEMEAALLVASEWIDGVYGPSFSGFKTGGFPQEREWPRQAAYTNTYPQYNFLTDEIPDRLKNATYQAAIRQLNSPGCLLVDYTPNKYKSVSVDGAISVDYVDFIQSSDIQIQISAIDQLLAPLLNCYDGAITSNLSGGVNRV